MRGEGELAARAAAANRQSVEALGEKTRRIRDISLAINTHLDEERRTQLPELQQRFRAHSPHLARLIAQIGSLGGGTSLRLYLLLALLALALLALLLALK